MAAPIARTVRGVLRLHVVRAFHSQAPGKAASQSGGGKTLVSFPVKFTAGSKDSKKGEDKAHAFPPPSISTPSKSQEESVGTRLETDLEGERSDRVVQTRDEIPSQDMKSESKGLEQAESSSSSSSSSSSDSDSEDSDDEESDPQIKKPLRHESKPEITGVDGVKGRSPQSVTTEAEGESQVFNPDITQNWKPPSHPNPDTPAVAPWTQAAAPPPRAQAAAPPPRAQAAAPPPRAQAAAPPPRAQAAAPPPRTQAAAPPPRTQAAAPPPRAQAAAPPPRAQAAAPPPRAQAAAPPPRTQAAAPPPRAQAAAPPPRAQAAAPPPRAQAAAPPPRTQAAAPPPRAQAAAPPPRTQDDTPVLPAAQNTQDRAPSLLLIPNAQSEDQIGASPSGNFMKVKEGDYKDSPGMSGDAEQLTGGPVGSMETREEVVETTGHADQVCPETATGQEPETLPPGSPASDLPFDNSRYQNLQHHVYTPFTFVDYDVDLSQFRLPQPSSGRPSPQS